MILYVAADMVWQGTHQVADQVPGAYAYLMLPLGYLALPQVFPPWIWAAATLVQVVVIAAVVAATLGAIRRIGETEAPHAPGRADAALPARELRPQMSAAE